VNRQYRSRMMKDQMPIVDLYSTSKSANAALKALRRELDASYVRASQGVTYQTIVVHKP
jgi:hypothetical protein